MMIRLTCDCYIVADQIAEVTVSEYGIITVRSKTGIGHRFEANYGESVYTARDRLLKEIDAALRKDPT